MKISNRTYDTIKWIALVAIPATQVLWLTVGKVWGFPYLTEVGATIGAVGLFLAALIGVSDKAYNESVIYEDDTYLEDGEEDEEDDIQAD